VEIGEVEDVDGYGGVTSFMGQGRKVYYTSTSGWSEEDDDGIFEYKVHGGFELRDFNVSKIIPSSSLHTKMIYWYIDMYWSTSP